MARAAAKTRPDRLLLIALLALAVLGCSLVIGLIPYQIDDAFITFRYARQLLQGNGFSFNPEGPPVEGFSSPAWLLLLAGLAGVFGRHAIPALATILGFLCYLLCQFGLCEPDGDGQGGRRYHSGHLFALALFIGGPGFFYYSVTGMETLLFLMVLLVFARAASGSAPLPAGILCGFAAAWVRPEGPWFLFTLLILAVVMDPGGFFRQRRFWLLAGAVIAGTASLVALRLWLFGSLFPNTYFAKPMVPAAAALYIRNSFLNGWALPLLLLALLGAARGRRRHRGYLLAALSWVLAAFLEGGDWMVHGRMLIPAFGLLCLAAAGIHGRFGERGLWPRIGQGIAIAGVMAACGFGLQQAQVSRRHALYAYEKTFYMEEMLAGWIDESGVRSAATIDIGMLGYYSSVSLLDLAGLTDERIARAPGAHLEKTFPLDYLFSEKRVDVIILRTSARPDAARGDSPVRNTGSEVELRLASDPRLAGDYRFIIGFYTADKAHGWYGKLVFARRDVIIPARLIPPTRILYLPGRSAGGRARGSPRETVQREEPAKT